MHPLVLHWNTSFHLLLDFLLLSNSDQVVGAAHLLPFQLVIKFLLDGGWVELLGLLLFTIVAKSHKVDLLNVFKLLFLCFDKALAVRLHL